MPTINKLPLLGTPSSGDQIPVYAPNSGDARRMSITALTDYMQDTLDLPDNSDEVSFLQSGTGAVTRTVQSKLRDVVSVKDFGAVGDGVTDDTAAIQAANAYAISAKRSLYFPAGDYLFTGSNYAFTTPTNQGIEWIGEAGNTKITISANGVIFNVRSNFSARFIVSGINFNVINPTTNNNATVFYIANSTFWGASFYFENCIFTGVTNCSIHAIRAFSSGAKNCSFLGRSAYSSTSGLLTTYDDAGVRLWGADGTLTVQDHSFSNLNRFENCFFGSNRYGVDGWGIYKTTFSNCTFEPHYIGLINRVNTGGAAGNVSSADKSGYAVGEVTVDNCWFEQIFKYAISNVDINPVTGADVNPTFKSTLKTVNVNNYYVTQALKKPALYDITQGEGVRSVLVSDGSPPVGFDFFYAFTNNPDLIYYRYSESEALNTPRIRAFNGISFGTNTAASQTLKSYEEGSFTPQVLIGATAQTVTPTGRYTKVGNLVHFEISFYQAGFSESGTGNLSIAGLPFVIENTDSVGNASVGYFEGYNGTEFAFVRLIKNTATGTIRKGGANQGPNVTDADLSASTFLLQISGSYRTAS